MLTEIRIYLLKAIELYCYEIEGKDVWHDGRFIDTWADEHIINELINCFAHYEKLDVLNALKSTNSLFEKVTRELAMKKVMSIQIRLQNVQKHIWKSV